MKKSKYDLALASIDARLGALRDIANFIENRGHGDKNSKAQADADGLIRIRPCDTMSSALNQIRDLQYARNLLTSAADDGRATGEAKPKRQRKPKAAKAQEPTL